MCLNPRYILSKYVLLSPVSPLFAFSIIFRHTYFGVGCPEIHSHIKTQGGIPANTALGLTLILTLITIDLAHTL